MEPIREEGRGAMPEPSFRSWGRLNGVPVRAAEGRFTPTKTGKTTTTQAVDADIAKVQKAYDLLLPQFVKMQDALQWKYATAQETNTFSGKAKTIETEFVKQNEARHGVVGIDTHLPRITDEKAIPEKTRKYQALEIRLRLFEKAFRCLKTMCFNDTFRAAYALYKSRLDSLYKRVTTTQGAQDFKDIVTDIKTAISKQLDETRLMSQNRDIRAIKQLHVEVINCALQAAKHLGLGEGDEPVRTLAELRAPLVQSLAGALAKKPLEAYEPKALTDADLASFHVRAKDLLVQEKFLQFSQHMYTGDWSWYQLGSWRETGRLGEEMQETVGLKLAGLHRRVSTRLEELSQGIIKPLDTLRQELDLYQNVLVHLQAKLKELRASLNEKPLEKISQYVRNYGLGLDEALSFTRYKLKQCYGFIRQDGRQEIDNYSILEAESSLFAHFNGTGFSPIPSLSSYQKAERLYQSSRLCFTAKKLGDKSFVDKFLKLTADVINEIHAQKDTHSLVLTADEQKVPDQLLSEIELDALRYNGESDAKLPVAIEAYLMKKMTKIIFLTENDFDPELELVLHKLSTTAKYRPRFERSKEANPLFRGAVDHYDQVYAEKRLTHIQLSEAGKLMALLLEVSGGPRNPLGYAKCWQGYFEFYQKHKPPLDVNQMLDQVNSYLMKRLQEVAEKNKYEVFYDEKTRDGGLDSYQIEGNPEYFLALLTSRAKDVQNKYLKDVEVLQKKIFHNLLFKALAAALYGRNPNEWKIAHAAIYEIFNKDEYAPLRQQLPDDIVVMLQENTMNKIIDEARNVTSAEGKLFADGPLARFFTQKTRSLDDTKVQHALFSLLKREKQLQDKSFTNLFIAAVGKGASDKWYSDYEARLSMNELSTLVAQLVLSEKDKPDDRAVFRTTLKQQMGNDAFDAWYQHHLSRLEQR